MSKRLKGLSALILMLALVFSSFPSNLAQAKDMMPRSAGGESWNEEEPPNDSEYWPLPDGAKIQNEGGAGINPLRASQLTYKNDYIDDQNDLVYELVWRSLYSSDAGKWFFSEMRVDSELRDKIKSVEFYSEKDKNWKTVPVEDLIYTVDRRDFFSTVGVLGKNFYIPVRMTLKPGIKKSDFARDLVVQFRTYHQKGDGKRDYFAKHDTRKPTRYSDYTYSTILPTVSEALPHGNAIDNSNTNRYTGNNTMSMRYDSEKNAMLLMMQYTHYSSISGNDAKPYVLEQVIPEEIVNALDTDRNIKIYCLDHNSEPMPGDPTPMWEMPIITNAENPKDNTIFEENGKMMIRVSENGFVEAENRNVWRGGPNGGGIYYHQTAAANPVYTVVEYPMDISKAGQLFPDGATYNHFAASSAFFTTAQSIREFEFSVPQDMSIPAGSELKIDFTTGTNMWGIQESHIYYGPQKPMELEDKFEWLVSNKGRHQEGTFESGVTLKAGDKLTLVTTAGLNKNYNGTVTFPDGSTTPISINADEASKNLLVLNSYTTGDILLKRTLYEPKVDDVFTDDETIKGSTKEAELLVQMFINNEGESYNTESGAEEPFPYVFDQGTEENQFPAGLLKKDMRVSVRNNRDGEFPSSFAHEKVKAKVNFHLNYTNAEPAILEKIAPENAKFLDEEGYEDKGFANPILSSITDENEIKKRTWPTKEEITRNDITEEKDKLYFIEWNTDALGTGTVYKKDTAITDKTDLYAQWGHKLILDPKGGSFPTYGDEWGLEGENLVRIFKTNVQTEAPTPTRDGYEFVGWSKDKDANPSNWEDNPFIPGLKTLEENFTAYAVWKAVVQETTDPNAEVTEGKVKIEFFADEAAQTGDSTKGDLQSTLEGSTNSSVKYLAYILDQDADFIAVPIPKAVGKNGHIAKTEAALWSPQLPADREKVNTVLEPFIAQYTQPDDVIHVNPDNPGGPLEGYVRITFKKGEHGSLISKDPAITGEHETLSLDVWEELTWADIKEAIPTVKTEEGWKHNQGWDPTLPKETTAVEVGDYTALYLKETTDPNEEAPAGYVKVAFFADEAAKTGEPIKGTLTSTQDNTITGVKYLAYFIKSGQPFSTVPIPTLTAKEDFEVNSGVAWNPSLPSAETSITENKEFVGRYESNPVIPYNPTNPDTPADGEGVPDKDADGDPIDVSEYVILGYTTDGNGKLKENADDTNGVAARSFLVRKNLKWNDESVQTTKPETIAADGYVFDRWDLDILTGADAVTTRTMTAHFKALPNIIPVTPDNENEAPSTNHVKVTFDSGTNGSFEENAVTEYWVKKNEELPLAKAPKATANSDYTFVGWNPTLPLTVTDTTTVTAQYKKTIEEGTNPQDAVKDGYKRVHFYADDEIKSAIENGTYVEGTTTSDKGTLSSRIPGSSATDKQYLYYDVVEGKTYNEIPVPVVKERPGYVQKAADELWMDTYPAVSTTIADSHHAAQYVKLGDVLGPINPDNPEPTDPEKPDGYVTVTYESGVEGSIAKKRMYYVNPNAEPKTTFGSLEAPAVTPHEGFTFSEKWHKKADNTEVAADFEITEDLTVVAQYTEAENTTPVETVPTIDEPINKDNPQIKIGSIDENADQIEIKAGENVVATLTKDADGNWSSSDATNYPLTAVTPDADGKLIVTPSETAQNALEGKDIQATVSNSKDTSNTTKDSNVVNYNTTAPAAPDVDSVKAGDDKVVVTKPAEDDAAKITITLPDNSTVEAVAENDEEGNWRVGDTLVTQTEDGKLEIPIDGSKIKENDKVKVTVTDTSNNTSDATEVTVGKAPDTEAPAAPTVDSIKAGDDKVVVTKPTEDDAAKITITLPDNSTVVAEKQEDGTWKVGDTAVVEKDGKLEIPVPADKVTEDGKVKVTVTDASNNTSDATEVTVGPEADTTAPAAPKVEPISAGDDKVVVTKPTEDDAAKITVTLPDGTKVVAEKQEDGTWKVGDTAVVEKDGKLEIPVPADKVTEDGKVKVTVTDASNNTSDATEVTVGPEADTTAPAAPKVEPISAGDDKVVVTKPTEDDAAKITVTLPDNSTVVAEKQEDGTWKVGDTAVVEKDGKLEIPVPADKVTEDGKVKVTVTDASNNTSDATEVTVGPEADTTAPAAPKVEPISAGDDKVVVTKPTEDDAAKITVTLPDNSTVVAEKQEDGTWKVGDTAVVEKDGKLEIPVPADKVTEGGKVKVTVTDSSDNESDATEEIVGAAADGILPVKPVDVEKPFNPQNQDDENNDGQTPDGYVRIIFDAADGDFGKYAGTNIAIKKIAFDVKKDVLWAELKDKVPDKVNAPKNKVFTGKWDPILPNDDVLVENDDNIFTAQYRVSSSGGSGSSGGTGGSSGIMPDKPKEPVEKPELEKHLHYAYMFGYPNNTFEPERAITRAEAAALFTRLSVKDGDIPVGMSQFSDVPNNQWYTKSVNYLASKGILVGYKDGTFRPNQRISRAEFAAIVSRFADVEPADKSFPDVATDHWAKNAINATAAAGWIRGYEDGTFRPTRDVSRAEVVSIVNRMLNRHADLVFIKEHLDDPDLNTFTDVMDENYWAYGEIMEATNGHDFERLADGEAERWISLNGKRF